MTDEHEPGKLQVALAHARPYLPILAAVPGPARPVAGVERLAADPGRHPAQRRWSRAATSPRSPRSTLLQGRPRQARTTAGVGRRALGLAGRRPGGCGRARWAATGPASRQAAVLPPTLQDAYAGLPKSGFGRLAAAEAALAEDKPVLWAIREDGQPAIALDRACTRRATPWPASPSCACRWRAPRWRCRTPRCPTTATSPCARAASPCSSAATPACPRAPSAARCRSPAPACASPPPCPSAVISPFGLGVLGSFIAALVLLLLAYVLWRLPSRIGGLQCGGRWQCADPVAGGRSRPRPEQAGAGRVAVKDAPKRDAGAHRPRHLPRLRHPRRRRADARCRRRRTDRPGGRHADVREGTRATSSSAATAACPGPDLVAGLIAGLRKAGRNVIDIGMVPTPVVYFGAFHLQHRLLHLRHRQPQPAGLQRLQDRDRRRDAVTATRSPTCTRASPRIACTPRRRRAALEPARHRRRLHPAHRLRRADRAPPEGRRRCRQRRRRRDRRRGCWRRSAPR